VLAGAAGCVAPSLLAWPAAHLLAVLKSRTGTLPSPLSLSLSLPSPPSTIRHHAAAMNAVAASAAGLPPLRRRAKLCRQRCCPSASPCPASFCTELSARVAGAEMPAAPFASSLGARRQHRWRRARVYFLNSFCQESICEKLSKKG